METKEIERYLDPRVKLHCKLLSPFTLALLTDEILAPMSFSMDDIPVEGKDGLFIALDLMYFNERNGYEVVGMRLYSKDPSRVWLIDWQMMRTLRIEDYKKYALSHVLLIERPGTKPSDFEYRPYRFDYDLHYAAEARKESGKLDLKAIARLYSAAILTTRNPREVLAKGFGVSKPAISKWVEKVRAEGYGTYTYTREEIEERVKEDGETAARLAQYDVELPLDEENE